MLHELDGRTGGFSYLDRIIIGMSFNPDNFDNFDEQRYKQEN